MGLSHKMASSRLYSKARILGYTRAKRNQKPTSSLVQIEGVADRKEAEFYFGKRIAYVYKAQKGGQRLKGPRHLGPRDARARQLWCRPGQVPPEPPAKVLRRLRPCDALPKPNLSCVARAIHVRVLCRRCQLSLSQPPRSLDSQGPLAS